MMWRLNRRAPLAVSSTVGLAMAFLFSSTAAAAPPRNPGVLTPTSMAFGQSYGAWSAAWWQYVLGQPVSTNPLLDTTGAGCGIGQSGPVFFLAGASGSGTATRDDCTVRAGKALFFPLVNGFDVHVPGDGLDTAQKVWDDMHVTYGFAITSLSASVDGVAVTGLDPAATAYRACAGPVSGCAPSFSLTFPTDNLFGLPAGTYAPAVADGVYLLLAPLPPGRHTITFGGSGNFGGSFSQAITYHLTVAG